MMDSEHKKEVSGILRKLPALVAKLQPIEKIARKNDLTEEEIDECLDAENPDLCRWTRRIHEMRKEYEDEVLAGKAFNRFDPSMVRHFRDWAKARISSKCGCGGHHKQACTCTPKAMTKTTRTPQRARKDSKTDTAKLFAALDKLPAQAKAQARSGNASDMIADLIRGAMPGHVDGGAMRERAKAAAVQRMKRKFGNIDTPALVFGEAILSAVSRKEYPDLRAELLARQATEHATKAGEVVKPSDWVSDQFLSAVWDYADRQSRIASLIETVEITRRYGQFIMPVETSGVSWYSGVSASDLLPNPAARKPYTAEELAAFAAADEVPPPLPPEGGYVEITLPTSRIGTSRIIGKPQYLTCSTSWSGELVEDAMVDFAPALMNSVLGELGRLLDSIVCDADTVDIARRTPAAPVNDAAGTNDSLLYAGHDGLLSESSTLSVARDPLLLFSGVRRKAVDDGRTTDMQDSALAATDILDVASLLEVGDSAPHNIRVVAPARVRSAYTKTLLAAGNAAAVRVDADGNVVYAGTPIVFSENVSRRTDGLTNSNGAMHVNGSENNRISLLAFDRTQWRFFRYPGIRFYIRRRPRADVYEIDFEVRIELKHRPGTSQAAAMLYAIDPGA